MYTDTHPLVINGSFLAQPPTGVQRFAVEICRRLLKQYPAAELVTSRNLRPSQAATDLKPRVIGQFTGHLWEQLDLLWYARRRRALLLNLDMKAPLLYRRKIITIHDLNFLHNPSWVSRRFYYFYRILVYFGSRTSQHVLTVSRFSQREIIRYLGVPSERITVIYNAVSPIEAHVAERTIEGDYVLSVASMDPRKNLHRLIRAFQRLDSPSVQLVLVGLPHRAHEVAADHRNIVFLGYVDEATLDSLYQHAVGFVYPSLYEGFGIPPLEAMQYGCPVVAARSSSLPEVCGDAVYYVNPEDVSEIAEGMHRILTDETLRSKLITKGYQRLKVFSWEKSASLLSELLNDMLRQ